MSGASYPPQRIVRQGNDTFRKAGPHYRTWPDPDLEVGETEWYGPHPLDGSESEWIKTHLADTKHHAKVASRRGIHLHVKVVGEYIRTRRLIYGPVRSLSDWDQLSVDTPMLLNPAPSPEDIELALNRTKYMRYNRYIRFHTWTDSAGALWVERLPQQPQ